MELYVNLWLRVHKSRLVQNRDMNNRMRTLYTESQPGKLSSFYETHTCTPTENCIKLRRRIL